MKKETRFFDMIVAFVVLGLALITFLVLFINYEGEKSNLPTPTPTPTRTPTPTISPTPTMSPTPTFSPTPTPGYIKAEWDSLFAVTDASYVITESTTDSAGLTLVNKYSIAEGSVYFFNQTTAKAAKEGWNLILENKKYVLVSGTLAVNKDGTFSVNKNGYKSSSTKQATLKQKNDVYVKMAEDMLSKFLQEIPYDQVDAIELFKQYKTKEDNKYQATITIDDGKIKTIEVEYTDDTDSKKPKTVKVVMEINTITADDIRATNPKK